MILTKSNNYNKKISDKRFWSKINNNAKSVGKKILIISLKMYYSFKDKDTPIIAKIKIFWALLYFVSPVDFILDPIPVLGYTDDYFILIKSIGSVVTSIKKENEYLANEYTEELFNK